MPISRRKPLLKTRKETICFYYRYPCKANISLRLVRTSLIGSMNLGDQLKLALLPRTVVGVIVKYLPVKLLCDKTRNTVLRTGKTMRQRGAHLSKFCVIGKFFVPIPQGAKVNESLQETQNILYCLKLNWVTVITMNMSLVVRKPAFCICENKGADQLRSNREADQRLCFRYMDSTIPLLSKSQILSL